MAPKRKMPVKTATLDLADEGYEGFHAETRTNTPPRLTKRYIELLGGGTGDETEARGLLLEMFPAWDFVDAAGKAIPHTADGFEEIPPDMVLAMLRARTRTIHGTAMPAPLGSESSTTQSPPTTDSRKSVV